MTERIGVEVAFALPEEQVIVPVSLESGATVAEAIKRSQISEEFPTVNMDTLQTGIWGRPVERTAQVADGDRVELYRPLLIDPRDARRELAQSGLTMRDADDE